MNEKRNQPCNKHMICITHYYLYYKLSVMRSRSKKTKTTLLFQYKLSYRIETGTNHHGLLSTLVWCFKFFLTGASTWGGLYLTLIFFFFIVNPQIFQRTHKVHLSNCLERNFHIISNISLSVIRHKNYSKCEILRGNFFLLNINVVNEIKWRKC